MEQLEQMVTQFMIRTNELKTMEKNILDVEFTVKVLSITTKLANGAMVSSRNYIRDIIVCYHDHIQRTQSYLGNRLIGRCRMRQCILAIQFH